MPLDAADLPDVAGYTVGVLGGTGPQGRGLAYRLACAGQRVLIGSRDAARGAAAARELTDMAGAAPGTVSGDGNAAVAAAADVVVAAVPWDGHAATLADLRTELAGKVVIDCVNPIGFDKQGPYAVAVPEGSATEQAAALLPDSRVVGAFHHLSAVLLNDPDVTTMATDVLVVADDRDAAALTQALAFRLPGVRGVFAGRLRNARQVEALTANILAINRRYKAHAGIRVTDV